MISGIVTGILLAAFLGVWAWAWSKDFSAAARLPLEDEPAADPRKGERP